MIGDISLNTELALSPIGPVSDTLNLFRYHFVAYRAPWRHSEHGSTRFCRLSGPLATL